MRPPPRPLAPSLLASPATVGGAFAKPGSRAKLRPQHAALFNKDTLFGAFAAAVCGAGVLPRKELYECWHVASIVQESFPESTRVADLAAGHGLLAWTCALLGGEELKRSAVCVDVAKPQSADILASAITDTFPWLEGSVEYVEGSIDAVHDSSGQTVIVGVHACGELTDNVLSVAMRDRASPVALLPCCHSLQKYTAAMLRPGGGDDATAAVERLRDAATKLGASTAIDEYRLERMGRRGYATEQLFISPEVTPYNRLLLGRPPRLDYSQSALEPSAPPLLRLGSDEDTLSLSKPAASRGKAFKGQQQAWESAVDIPVGTSPEDRAIITALATRPRAEWLRSFDISFWLDDDSSAAAMDPPAAEAFALMAQAAIRGDDHQALPSLQGPTGEHASAQSPESSEEAEVEQDGVKVRSWIIDRFEHPKSGRRAMTVRTELRSATREISREDASSWYARVREALTGAFEVR
jgi:hypothetical protein